MTRESENKVAEIRRSRRSGGRARVLLIESNPNTSKVSLLAGLRRVGFDVFVLSHERTLISKTIYDAIGCAVIYGGTLADAVAAEDIDVVFIDNPHYYVGGSVPRHDFYKQVPAAVSERVLFCYVPYAYISVDDPAAYTDFFHRESWKFFLESDFHLIEYLRFNAGRACDNAFVSGHPYLDPYFTDAYDFLPSYRPHGAGEKILTWCPHHNQAFYNQLSFFDQERELRRIISGDESLKIAFRPHPNLFASLDSQAHRESRDYKTLLGRESVAEIKEFWLNHPRVIDAARGPIYQLFKESDAIVHNCGGYQVEAVFSGAVIINTVNRAILNQSARQYAHMQQYPESVDAFRDALMGALYGDPSRGLAGSTRLVDRVRGGVRPEAGDVIARHLAECLLW